jgi:uncharacterized protein (DUF1697 family)
MSIHIALLRGINVSGHKPVKMDELRKSFETLGFKKVRTYVQSGNVVFESEGAAAGLGGKIQERLRMDFGYEVPVLVRTAKEMEQAVRDNPLPKERGLDAERFHVTFLSDKAPRTAAKDLAALAAKPERYRVAGREIYLYCPKGYGRSKLANAAIEKMLGVGATTRNWKTVNALLAMARG